MRALVRRLMKGTPWIRGNEETKVLTTKDTKDTKISSQLPLAKRNPTRLFAKHICLLRRESSAPVFDGALSE